MINKIIREIKIFFQSPKMFYFRYFKCFIPNTIFWIKKDISIKLQWHEIIFPNEAWVQRVLMETFMRDLFKDMHWLDKVLDIWWFIWESAIYLSIHNKEVYTYELSPTNFKYLEKNCSWIKNIKYFNWCVWVSEKEYTEFSDLWTVSSINKKDQVKWNVVRIKNYNIIDILKENKFDWLKLDIEWWEYDIIKPIIDGWLFNFKKWIIEFHELDIKEKLEYLKKFLIFLEDNMYSYKILSNENQILNNLNGIKFCNIVFVKTMK